MELTRHLVLVRHGESELNALSRRVPTYCGQVETPLNDVGRQQACLAGRRVAALEYVSLTAAISSPLKRAEETLSLVLEQLLSPVERLPSDPRLMERSHGQFEGLAQEVAHRDYPHYRDDPNYSQFMNHFEQCAPGGETLLIVMQRAWTAVLSLLGGTTGDVLLVSHFNPIRCIIGRALELSREETLKLHVPNAQPIVFSYNGTFKLVEAPDLTDWGR
jgi:2,3-bisphosphoglycerate-dependent phosphoglycerate mutase